MNDSFTEELANAYLDFWHNFKAYIRPDRYVEFYRDGSLIYTTTSKLGLTYNLMPLVLGTRSHEAYGLALHDNIKVYVPSQITSIADVGDDQGLQVRVPWQRTTVDCVDSPEPITSIACGGGSTSARGICHIGMNMRKVGGLQTRGEEVYNTISPTLGDSTASGIFWTVFFVCAHTEVPSVYYDSGPDSSYSIDSIAPIQPRPRSCLLQATRCLSVGRRSPAAVVSRSWTRCGTRCIVTLNLILNLLRRGC